MPASHGRRNECWLTECQLFPVSVTQTSLFTRSHAPSARHFLECHLQTGSPYAPVCLGQHWLMLASTLKASVSGRCVILWPYLRRTDARKPNPTPTMWLRNGREEDGYVYRSRLPLEPLEGKNGTGDCVPAGAPVARQLCLGLLFTAATVLETGRPRPFCACTLHRGLHRVTGWTV